MIVKLLAKFVYCVYLPDDEELDKILSLRFQTNPGKTQKFVTKIWLYTVYGISKERTPHLEPPSNI